MLPKGTHNYENFIKPRELLASTRHAGLDAIQLTGLEYNPLTQHYRLSRDTSVNYLLATRREA
jgi:2-polyprenyl-6-hydroxyphenyl methylase/3-demethylubiquinone-9 3-methyltransferase